MSNNKSPEQWIQYEYTEFENSVDSLSNVSPISAYRNTYDALYRLEQRYKTELPSLNKSLASAYYLVFQGDKLVSGALNLRNVSDHTHKCNTFEVGLPSGPVIELPVEASAGLIFSAPVARVIDILGGQHVISHADLLRTARDRIGKHIK